VRSFVFPEFEVFLANGNRITKTEFASSSLSYVGAYGQVAAYTLTIIGDDAFALEESGVLAEGTVMLEVRGGYRDDELVMLARNLVIWDSDYDSDSSSGRRLTVTGYGCSQFLRQSGQRTERLVAKTYAEAAREVAARWGLTIRIGAGAYRTIPPESAAQKEIKISSPPSAQQVNAGILKPAGLSNTQVLGAALRVANGQRLPSMTDDTVTVGGYCAQFVRQVVEHGLRLPVNKWPVAVEALRINSSQNLDFDRSSRSAIEYEAASRNLKLNYPGPPQPGDILFQPFTNAAGQPYGHVAIYIGEYSGVPSVVENTIANRGVAVFGSGPVRRTALADWGAITTIARAASIPAAVQETSGQPSAPTGDVSGGLGGAGTTATLKPGIAQDKPRKSVFQENETDWAFLEKIAREIGYIVSETDTANELYFGPGLEVGSRDRYLLVHGEYSVGGDDAPANVSSLRSRRTLYGIPAEIVVTGFENGKRFALVVSPEDLADRHKIKVSGTEQARDSAGRFTTDVSGGLGGAGTTATLKPPVAPAGTPKKGKTITQGAADYASQAVSKLVSGAYPVTKRAVLGGSSSRTDAVERGLEALALEQLRFQEVEVSIFGLPGVRPGHEIILQGSEVPRGLRGLYLVRSVGGDLSGEGGYNMTLTLNRNTTARQT
jgi:cell wall-associated NlpC family hydrolase